MPDHPPETPTARADAEALGRAIVRSIKLLNAYQRRFIELRLPAGLKVHRGPVQVLWDGQQLVLAYPAPLYQRPEPAADPERLTLELRWELRQMEASRAPQDRAAWPSLPVVLALLPELLVRGIEELAQRRAALEEALGLAELQEALEVTAPAAEEVVEVAGVGGGEGPDW